MIAGVVLAAGSARRFGGPKLLHDVDGRPMLLRAVDAALHSRLDEVHVVIARGDRGVAETLRAEVAGRVVVHENADPGRGMMSSLKLALGALSGRADAAVVMLADMPFVSPALIDALVAIHERSLGVVIPVSGGQWRHPRVIPSRLFAEFLALPDGARGTVVLERHDADVVLVSGGSPSRYVDVDEPADLEALHPNAGGQPSKS